MDMDTIELSSDDSDGRSTPRFQSDPQPTTTRDPRLRPERRTPGGPPGHARREGASQVALEERHHPCQDPALGHDPAGQRRAAHKPTTKTTTNRCRPPLRPEDISVLHGRGRTPDLSGTQAASPKPNWVARTQLGVQPCGRSTDHPEPSISSHNEEEQAPYVEDVGSDDSGRGPGALRRDRGRILEG
ncbi:hypothetical protein M5D96_014001 [Drosophila gunungcola]|uniref:Uncharacterized protein n=1 Tax=Drosophila gunungcola TaxID=103775 RepID=A0A9Q0BHU6_9MUSC|nr:hypothetical protein M5D96_014001 [Drosophila gunungcola]